jgi:hypothetical protein
MKRTFFVVLLFLIQYHIIAQKVNVVVTKTGSAAVSDWQIFDEQYNPVFSGSEYFRDDSVIFNLEADKRYILQVSVNKVLVQDTSLFSLSLNGDAIMMIRTDIGPGDHIYPFFTGLKTSGTKITGGTTASITDFPWQVFYISGNYMCGGTIISPGWVITAAHCTKGSNNAAIPASQMSVKVGADNPYSSSQGKIYGVSEVIVHESFNSVTLENDVALLRLKDQINYPNAVSIKLISAEDVANGATDPGVLSWVTGWGLTKVSPETFPTSLQKVQLPIVSNTTASSVWKDIPETVIMAGYLNGNKDACNGDSGGPMVVPVFDSYKLAGIVSWGSTNCNTYGAYTRISSFETWIRTKTGIPKDYFPPAPAGDSVICQGTSSDSYSVAQLPAASAYEWKMEPVNAGNITWSANSATVAWNRDYLGAAGLYVRVTINDVVSEWSGLNINIVRNTRLTGQSRDTIICEDQPVTLKTEAEGYRMTYSWYKDNNLVQSGNSAKLILSHAVPSNSGLYKCQVNGYCGNHLTNNISLTVYPLTQVTDITPDTEVALGDNFALEVTSDGHDLSYSWQKDGKEIANSDSPQYLLGNVNANVIGLYRVAINGTCGTDTSKNVYVYVKKENHTEEPQVFIWPTIASDQFNVALSNEDLYNIRIINSQGSLVKEVTNCQYQKTINISTLPEGNYYITIYNKKFRNVSRLIKI